MLILASFALTLGSFPWHTATDPKINLVGAFRHFVEKILRKIKKLKLAKIEKEMCIERKTKIFEMGDPRRLECSSLDCSICFVLVYLEK